MVIIDTQALGSASKVLSELFPHAESQPVYSIGFQRWQKRTKKQHLSLMIAFNGDGEAIRNALETQTVSQLMESCTLTDAQDRGIKKVLVKN